MDTKSGKKEIKETKPSKILNISNTNININNNNNNNNINNSSSPAVSFGRKKPTQRKISSYHELDASLIKLNVPKNKRNSIDDDNDRNDIMLLSGEHNGQQISAKIFWGDSKKRGKHELEILQAHPHENIVVVRGHLKIQNGFVIVYDPLIRSLDNLLYDAEIELPLIRKLIWAQDCITALSWLHGGKNSVLHRNLSSSSLVLDSDWSLNLQNFENAVPCDSDPKIFPPISEKEWKLFDKAPVYMSPEAIMGKQLTLTSDIYSFGIILLELLTGKQILQTVSQLSPIDFRNDMRSKFLKPDIPKKDSRDYPIHPELNKLILECLDENPKKRPKALEICQRFPKIIIQTCLQDCNVASNFWASLTNGEDVTQVSFQKFVYELYKVLKEPLPQEKSSEVPHDRQLRVLTKVLQVQNECHLIDFANLIHAHGPLNSSFLKRISKIYSQVWYHGDITAEVAQKRVSAKGDWFLIRNSVTHQDYPFSLIVKKDKVIAKYRIKKEEEGYRLKFEGTVYKSANFDLIGLIGAVSSSGKLGKPAQGNDYSMLAHKNPPKTTAKHGYMNHE